MKKLLSILSVLILAIFIFAIAFVHPSYADASAELVAKGAKVFSANCAACHMNGNNVVDANKNLKAETLKKFGMDSTDAIVTQVTNGKNAMPSFKSRLNEEQIQAVAAYVLTQSAKGW